MRHPPFIERVKLRNYRSIAACDVALGRLTFLVGPNGSGKSNFLDALRFVSDAIRYSLDHALRDRGGINEVRRRSRGHPNHFGIRIEFNLTGKHAGQGFYAFEIAAKRGGAYGVKEEHCHITYADGDTGYYEVKGGRVIKSTLAAPPPAAPDRLYLINVSGFSVFRPLYDALLLMGFYNLNPDVIRDLQTPDPGDLLSRDGGNLASVWDRLSSRTWRVKSRIEEYLSKVVPGIQRVDHKPIGPKETLEFKQTVKGDEHPWRFLGASMSDGTLRAFAVLVALFQGNRNGDGSDVRLVGIEEPEIALHPAAAGVLVDGIKDASSYTQIIVTSHSPDLLDDEELTADAIRAVLAEEGETKIGRLDEAGRQALHDHLYTAGDLLRMNQLLPDEASSSLQAEQLNLFGVYPEPAQ